MHTIIKKISNIGINTALILTILGIMYLPYGLAANRDLYYSLIVNATFSIALPICVVFLAKTALHLTADKALFLTLPTLGTALLFNVISIFTFPASAIIAVLCDLGAAILFNNILDTYYINCKRAPNNNRSGAHTKNSEQIYFKLLTFAHNPLHLLDENPKFKVFHIIANDFLSKLFLLTFNLCVFLRLSATKNHPSQKVSALYLAAKHLDQNLVTDIIRVNKNVQILGIKNTYFSVLIKNVVTKKTKQRTLASGAMHVCILNMLKFSTHNKDILTYIKSKNIFTLLLHNGHNPGFVPDNSSDNAINSALELYIATFAPVNQIRSFIKEEYLKLILQKKPTHELRCLNNNLLEQLLQAYSSPIVTLEYFNTRLFTELSVEPMILTQILTDLLKQPSYDDPATEIRNNILKLIREHIAQPATDLRVRRDPLVMSMPKPDGDIMPDNSGGFPEVKSEPQPEDTIPSPIIPPSIVRHGKK